MELNSLQFFVWCLLPKRWAMFNFRQYTFPSDLQVVLLALRLWLTSSHVAALPLAADDADFMRSLFLGFGSDRILSRFV